MGLERYSKPLSVVPVFTRVAFAEFLIEARPFHQVLRWVHQHLNFSEGLHLNLIWPHKVYDSKSLVVTDKPFARYKITILDRNREVVNRTKHDGHINLSHITLTEAVACICHVK